MLRNYAFREFGFESVALYRDMARSGCQGFDSFSYLYLIKGCDGMNGFEVHGVVLKVGFGSHVYVMTGLLDMYLGFGSVVDARKVFDEMPERSLVTWNVMVTGSVRWGEVESAWGLFEEMKVRNVVSWTGMIDGFTRCHKYGEAFGFFRRMMKEEGVMPNEITCLAIFPAVANLGHLKNCQAIQTYGVKRGFDVSDIRFGNSLIDVYAKCGCVASASRVFEEVSISHKKNLVSWTSLISGFAMHGMAKEAVENFDKMVDEGWGPNRVTFLSLLGACSHGGLVEEGVEFFRRMTDQFQVLPDAKHYGCVIDMLARAGRLKEAEKLALEIPQETENVVIWRTLLGACSFHGNVEMAERVTRRIQELERGYGGDYVLMSNILTGFRKFDDAEKMRTLMEERDVSKKLNSSGMLLTNVYAAEHIPEWSNMLPKKMVQKARDEYDPESHRIIKLKLPQLLQLKNLIIMASKAIRFWAVHLSSWPTATASWNGRLIH
ncbi:Pentatricopeptide repeat-containing protein [Drosera capensis]